MVSAKTFDIKMSFLEYHSLTCIFILSCGSSSLWYSGQQCNSHNVAQGGKVSGKDLVIIMRGCHPVWPPYLCVHVSESGIYTYIDIYISICTLSAQAVVQQTDLLQPMFGCTALEVPGVYNQDKAAHADTAMPSGIVHGHTCRCILVVHTQDRAAYA